MVGAGRRPYRLGLDVGSNSLGWFMVWLDAEGGPSGLGPGGVRIYPDGRDPKSKTSNAVDRRTARGARRRRDRYLSRRTKLIALLIAHGLMPEDAAARKRLESLDPYELRAKALDTALPAHHLGRALFHLDQRRGFLSNRKTEKEEDHKLTERISELKRAMFECDARTLGQYLWRRRKAGMMVRARPEAGFYAERELYAREFEEIRRAQLPYQTVSAEAWEELRATIFHQRDLKPVDPGWCLLEDGEQRAPRALPCAQEFRIVQETNNLRILVDGEPARKLTAHERQRVVGELRTKNELKLERLPKLLGLPTGARINLLDENRKKLKGDETTVRLKTLFGRTWFDPSFARTAVVRRLIDVEDPKEIERIAQDEWGLDPTNAKKLANVPLPQGFARLSELAINKILPLMEERGLGYAEAIAEIPEYGHHSDFRPSAALNRLPYYGAVLTRHVFGADPTKPVFDEVGHYGRLANPTVHIGLNQLRRVVNALVEAYGKPEEIVIEVARELKLTKEERDKERQRNKDNEQANRRREQQIRDAKGIPSAYLLRKLRLWEEQSFGLVRVCPFTGATISFEMAISEQTEIEHILPFSRTLDDSLANKVLCLPAANRVKRDRAPSEAFGSNPWVGKYQCIYEEILVRADTLPPNKRWRFYPNAMERFANEQEFLDRQLNETKYLSRIARFYLAHLYNEKSEGRLRVRAIPGKLTWLLRGKWG